MTTNTDLIIGVIKGYDWDKVSLWAESLVTCGYEGSAAIIQYEDENISTNEAVATKLRDLGIQVVRMPLKGPIFHQRFYDISRLLKANAGAFRYVIATDVRDVVFQTDPIDVLDTMLSDPDKAIYAASEALLYKHEGWGSSNLAQSFGVDGEHVQNLPIYNAGVISGKAEAIADLFFHIYVLSKHANYPVGGGGPDQAAYNLILSSSLVKPSIYYGEHNEGYAAQLGTTADPHKIAGFRPNLLSSEPGFDETHGEVVIEATGKPYAIVHQYDRTPHWEPAIRARVAKLMEKRQQE